MIKNIKKPKNEKRFLQFEEFKDGSGFKLKDGSIFKYDKSGGWYDECDNYYDSNGKAVYNKKK